MKKARVFYKLFIPFFLVGIGLVIGFSIFIYNSTYHSLEESFLKDKKSYTKQILHNVEQKVRTIEYGYTAYSATSNFEEIFKNPLSGKDFDIYRDIKKEISYIEMMGIEGSNNNLVSLDGNWGIINGSLKMLTTEEVTEYENTYINNNNNNLFWKPIKSGIEMVMTLPMYKRDKFALGISYIPRRSIEQIIGDKNNIVEIYNKKNQLLYSSMIKDSEEKKGIFQDFKAVSTESEQTAKVIETDDGKKYVYMQSDYNRWLYVVEIDENEIGRIIHNTRVGLFIVSALLICLVGIISYLLAVSYTRPIKKIQEKLDIKGVHKKQNELSF